MYYFCLDFSTEKVPFNLKKILIQTKSTHSYKVWIEPAMKQMFGDQKCKLVLFPTFFVFLQNLMKNLTLGQKPAKQIGILGEKVTFGQENLGWQTWHLV